MSFPKNIIKQYSTARKKSEIIRDKIDKRAAWAAGIVYSCFDQKNSRKLWPTRITNYYNNDDYSLVPETCPVACDTSEHDYGGTIPIEFLFLTAKQIRKIVMAKIGNSPSRQLTSDDDLLTVKEISALKKKLTKREIEVINSLTNLLE